MCMLHLTSISDSFKVCFCVVLKCPIKIVRNVLSQNPDINLHSSSSKLVSIKSIVFKN